MTLYSSHNLNHYPPWRISRVRKLVGILGGDYLKGKRVLELGCGHGNIGKFFTMIGCNVTFAEGRFELYDQIRNNNPESRILTIDQDHPWEIIGEKFDVILHWGVLYHLDNWQQDLACTVKHLERGGYLCLESEVLDSDQDEEVKWDEEKQLDDQAINGIGTRASALRIENELTKLGLKFTRYDDADLNTEYHCYNWKIENTKTSGAPHRRFWVCSL